MRCNAIKLHAVMVVFIQYIALADLLLTIFRALSVTVSFAANRWLFGKLWCRIGYFVFCSVGATLCLLITALCLTKLLIVKFPLRAIWVPTKMAHLSALIFFISALTVTGLASATDVEEIYFSYLTYNCEMSRSPTIESWTVRFSFILSGFTLVICIVIVIVSSILLIVIAKKITDRGPGGLQWQGIMTVLLSVASFLIATLPMAVFVLVYFFLKSKDNSFWTIHVFRIANCLMSLNLVSNFYIYTLTLTSFRQFLKSRMKSISASLVRCCAANGDEFMSGQGERQRLLG